MDNNGDDGADIGDIVTHTALNNLLNDGSNTGDTLPGGHDGRDDERAAIVGNYVLILPTHAELVELRDSQSNQTPENWHPTIYWTATNPSENLFRAYSLQSGDLFDQLNYTSYATAFQVRLVVPNLTFGETITAQTYKVGQTVALTLPDASGSSGTPAYTLTPTVSIPAGLTFDAIARSLKGTPTTATAVTLTYAATAPNAIAVSQTFMVTVNAIAPTAAPTDVKLTPGNTKISVSWTPVPDANNGGAEITVYTATATRDDTTFTTCTATGAATGAAATTCDIIGLDNDEEYSVTVVATNIAGDSMPSTAVSATPAMFVFVAGIDAQSYTVGENVTITLPEATGGIGTLSYSLTPKADIPAGLAFDPAPATRILSGIPSAIGNRTLTYTVTDSNTPPASIALTFNVKVSRVTAVTKSETEKTTVMLDLDGDGDNTTGTEGILTLPINHEVTEVVISTPPASATSNPPNRVEFSLTTDIALNANLAEDATVCLPTTSVPAGLVPVLYHYTSDTWNEIGRDTPGADFVCGTTQTFSPFAVGSTLPPKFNMPISNQIYHVGIYVSVTLPDASSGDDSPPQLSYTLTPTPIESILPGLTFDEVTRTLAGTPTMETAATALTYRVTDTDPDVSSPVSNSSTFTVTVVLAPTTTARLNEQILTRASQAMTASTLEAVARRVEAAAGGAASRAGGAGTTSALCLSIRRSVIG